MDGSPLRKILGLGVAALFLLTLMYVFVLGNVADTGVGAVSKAVRTGLAAALEPGASPSVSLLRDGSKASSPREYVIVIRIRSEAAMLPDGGRRAAQQAAVCALAPLDDVEAKVTFRCRAEWPGGSAEARFARVGEKGFWQLTPLADAAAAPPPAASSGGSAPKDGVR